MTQRAHEFLSRCKALFLKRRLDREMADELAFHQSMLKDKLIRQGVPPTEAELATQRRFGNAGRWQERLRELWQFRRLENLVRDTSFSARVLRKSPGFTLVAILTLALGVGANTTVFSIINGLLLRPLPVPASNRLAVLGISDSSLRINYSYSEPLFRGLENDHAVFSSVFAFSHNKSQVKSSSGTETAQTQLVSGDFFAALQTPPLMGRTLTRSDDAKGGNAAGFAAVISDGFWQRWFDRGPNVIGQKLRIDNTLFTVVGVMPKQFIGADPLERPEIFMSLAAEPAMSGVRSMTAAGVHGWWLTVMGRLQPDASLEQANARLAAVSTTVLRQSTSETAWIAQRESKHFHFLAEPGSAGFTYVRLVFKKPLVAVFAMCGGILLLACLNLAGLLMARGAARQREFVTRFSMGATRSRLVQQLMVESALIALAGTAAGLVASPIIGRSLSVFLLSGQFETHVDTSLDIRVFAFAAIAASLASLIVGLVPALQATSGNLNEQIKQGQHTTQAHERQRILPRIMMTSEVALALMLVVGAGLLASSLVRLYKSGAGFDARGVENIAFSMNQQPLKGDALLQFYRQIGDSLLRQPGVRAVSWAEIVPLSNMEWDQNFSANGGKEFDVDENAIGPGYFEAMRIPFLDGRDFRWDDTSAGGKRVILNRTAANLLLPGRNPLGQILMKNDDGKRIPFQVIGVVGDTKYDDMRSPAPPIAYQAITQNDSEHAQSYTAVVRMDGPPAPLAGAARVILHQLNPDIPVPTMTSMSSVIDNRLSAERTMALLSVFFALCALIVTAIGLYGTLAYATARRASEIGIRMALGARRSQVARMVFLQNSAVAFAGTATGLVAALLASRFLASFLYGTSTRDPWVYAVSIAALAMIATAASLLPAIRAARIEPMEAIRCE